MLLIPFFSKGKYNPSLARCCNLHALYLLDIMAHVHMLVSHDGWKIEPVGPEASGKYIPSFGDNFCKVINKIVDLVFSTKYYVSRVGVVAYVTDLFGTLEKYFPDIKGNVVNNYMVDSFSDTGYRYTESYLKYITDDFNANCRINEQTGAIEKKKDSWGFLQQCKDSHNIMKRFEENNNYPNGPPRTWWQRLQENFSEADFQVILPILLSISGFLTYFSVRCKNYKEFEKKKWKKINNAWNEAKIKNQKSFYQMFALEHFGENIPSSSTINEHRKTSLDLYKIAESKAQFLGVD